jgi:hypothetical protein
MELTLFYNGDLLKTKKATPNDKQKLRRHFHSQLKVLWNQSPLSEYQYLLSAPYTGPLSILKPIGKFVFAPLVSNKIHSIAELDIILLRPGPPGEAIISGDIDNRLKTLFDALKVPHENNALPPGDNPRDGENPFFVLLEDDSLITKVSVNTYQLLKEGSYSDVVLIVKVTTKLTKSTMDTIGL